MSRICYNPIKGCDDVIANLIPGENKFSIANLRGLLEEKEGVQYVTDLMMNPKTPLKEQYKGKLIFAQSGTGKTSIADNVNVIDSDYIMASLLGVDTPLAMDAFNLLNKKEKIEFSKLYDQAIKTLVKQGRTVITGRLKSLADADVIIYNNSVSETDRRTGALDRTNKYKNTKYQKDSFRQIEAVAKTTTKEVVKLGDDKFLKDVLLTDTDFNMPVRRLKEYSALEGLAIDFFNHFGISLQEFNEDGFSINHVERIINLKDSGQITPAMGETIAYMMQYNAKLKELIAEMAVEKGVITKEKMYLEDGNINDRSYKSLDRSLFIKVIGKMIADELKYLYEHAKTNDSFDNRESKSTILSRIKDIIKEFFDKLVKNERFIKDALDYATYVAINTLSKNNALIKASLLKPGDEESGRTFQVNLDKALTENPYEKDLILNLSKEGFYLGGSAGMAVQGAIFRPEENPLHDIDFEAGEKTKEDLDKILPKIVGNVEHVRTIKNEVNGEIVTTETYITFTTPFEIRRLDGFSAYSVIEKATGEVIGTFTGSNLTMTEYANNNNIKGKFLDFFTENTPLYSPVSYNFKGETLLFGDSRTAFHAKLNIYNARLKDVWDYNRYKPFGFKDNVLSNIKPEVTTIKPGVTELFESNPELANQVYEALGFGKDKNTIDAKPKANIPQNLVSGVTSFGTKQEANNKAKELLGNNPHSIDMIEAGIRTRTTRSVGEMKKYNVRVGDIVKQFGKSADGTTKQILTRITAIHPKGTPGFFDTWKKEGWTDDGVKAIERFKDGAAAIEFEVINDNQITPEQKQEAQRQYSQYLDTVFPDNEVTEINDSLYNSVLNQLEQENKIEKDCTGGGKLKAEKGLRTSFTKGSKWEIIKDLKGYPSHSQGGVDVKIGKNGFSFTRGNGVIEAKHGLVLPKIK